MALWFVTQIVENNYSVVDSNVKLRSLNCIIFQPSTRSRDCGDAHICTKGRAPRDVEIRRSRAKSRR